MPSSPQQHVPDRGVMYGLAFLLILAPLPLASNRTWAIAPLLGIATLLVIVAVLLWRHQWWRALERLWQFRWPIAALAAYALFVHFQTLPLPESWVALLSPKAYAIQRVVAEQNPGFAFRLSVDPYHTQLYANLSTLYLTVFVLAILVLRHRHRIERFAEVMMWSGVAQAVIAIVLLAYEVKYRLFFTEIHHVQAIGTFVNRNHLAGYLELSLAIGIGLMLARLGRDTVPAPNWQQKMLSVLRFVLSKKMRLRLWLIVMVVALVLTRSRMGNTAFFASLLVVGAVALLLARRMAPVTVALVTSLIVIDIAIVGAWIGVDKVVERLQQTTLLAVDHVADRLDSENGQRATSPPPAKGQSLEERVMPARFAFPLVRDFLWFGSGGGTFYVTFSQYRPPEIDAYFDHAHNDYIEIVADTGLFGAGLLASFALLTVIASLRILAKAADDWSRGIAFGVLMAWLALAIHGTVDFNLQIPANALTLVAISAIGWSLSGVAKKHV
ncbi:MAG: O-antigen ligase family protein [Hydrogenophilus sp.]